MPTRETREEAPQLARAGRQPAERVAGLEPVVRPGEQEHRGDRELDGQSRRRAPRARIAMPTNPHANHNPGTRGAASREARVDVGAATDMDADLQPVSSADCDTSATSQMPASTEAADFTATAATTVARLGVRLRCRSRRWLAGGRGLRWRSRHAATAKCRSSAKREEQNVSSMLAALSVGLCQTCYCVASGHTTSTLLQPLHAERDGLLAVLVGDLVADARVHADHQLVLRAGLRERLLRGGDRDLRPLDRAVRVLVAVGDEQRRGPRTGGSGSGSRSRPGCRGSPCPTARGTPAC